ncbi:MAG: hypothetical protein CL908_26650 [Deltaproteobacteria bacterium]|nr:hypothetical protein [Deltaproteobacteria bacterium]
MGSRRSVRRAAFPSCATSPSARRDRSFEQELEGQEFLVGGLLSIADIAVVCQLTQLELVVGRPDGGRWPNTVAFIERVSTRPSFAPNLAICRKIVKETMSAFVAKWPPEFKGE